MANNPLLQIGRHLLPILDAGMLATGLAAQEIPYKENILEKYVTTFREMAEAMIGIQRYDGFWNVSLADSNDYGGKETSGTAFFTYGLATIGTWNQNEGYQQDTIKILSLCSHRS